MFSEPLLATTNPAVGIGEVSGPSRSVHRRYLRSYTAWAHDIWRPHSVQHSATDMSKKWSTTWKLSMSPDRLLKNATKPSDNEPINAMQNTLHARAYNTFNILSLYSVISFWHKCIYLLMRKSPIKHNDWSRFNSKSSMLKCTSLIGKRPGLINLKGHKLILCGNHNTVIFILDYSTKFINTRF